MAKVMKELQGRECTETRAEIFGKKELELEPLERTLEFVGLPLDICYIILSFLDFKDLLRLQETCTALHMICGDEQTWKRLVLQQNWGLESEMRSVDISNWKEIYKGFWARKKCLKCGEDFRECQNSKAACLYHPGTRALWEDYNSGPSGNFDFLP
jgi:hypothetical protein